MRSHGALVIGLLVPWLVASLEPTAALADPPSVATAATATAAAAAPSAPAPATATTTPVAPTTPPASVTPATPAAAPTAPAAATPKGKAPPAPALPESMVRLWIMAPSPDGPWAFRIDNEGPSPVRIPADIRLLRFEVDNGEGFVAPTGPGAAKRPARRPSKPMTCKLPEPLRPATFPDRSALLLAPGEAYVESFNPRLFCFGKDASAALTGGAVVRAWFGFPSGKPIGKAPPTGPFAVESTAFPPTVAPVSELAAPTMVLSYAKSKPASSPREAKRATVAVDADNPEAAPTFAAPRGKDERERGPAGSEGKRAPTGDAEDKRAPADAPADAPEGKRAPTAPGSVDKPSAPDAAKKPQAPRDDRGVDPGAASPEADPLTRAPIVDENAPRLELTTSPFVDASAPTQASLTVTATNVGHRPMLVAIRPRMLAFRIQGPGGSARCDASPPTHAIPREMFTTLRPGGSTSLTMRLAEICSLESLSRPGLYRVNVTLRAGESGEELGVSAYTGVIPANSPTSLRLLSAPDPFYVTKPRAVPIPRPPAARDEEGPEEAPSK